ncbi:MAG: DNA primase [Alphaproteobacteria bacterium]|nr:DNA primase [Alphaproteobacteria bacterium]
MAPNRTNFSNFTDELRARLSIVDVVGKRVPLTKKGDRYWGCCPFHNEKTPSFTVVEDKGFYKCFGCGEGGDIISFTMKINNMDFKAAIEELANMAGMKLPDFKPRDPNIVKHEEELFNICDAAANTFHEKLFTPDGAAALEYLRKRGFTDDMIKKYRIGYAPKNNIIANKFAGSKYLVDAGLCRRGDFGLYDFFRDRLMFPLFNANGKIVAFSGRSLDGSEPKYKNTTDTDVFHKRRTVFGLNFARDAIHRANRSIVVEGQIDAIKMQTNGFGETVAPLGTALTDEHIAILCKLNRNITFCFDGDGAGQKAAARACSIMMPFLRDISDVRFAFVSGGKDPDEILEKNGVDAMKKIIDNAVPLVDFLWELANKNFVVATPGGKLQAEKFLDAELDKIADPELKKFFKQEYDKRKFQSWQSWKKNKEVVKVKLPDIDAITKNTLIYIVNNFPELAEKYLDFLGSLGIDFDGDASGLNMDLAAAEKFIVSLKLHRYLDKLNSQKRELTNQWLETGDNSVRDEINNLDAEIEKYTEKLEVLLTI